MSSFFKSDLNPLFQLSTRKYDEEIVLVTQALIDLENECNVKNGYQIEEPFTKFGWTFFKLAFKPNLQTGIEKEFSDMLQKYRWSDQSQKFAKFIEDYFNSRNCKVKVKIVD